MRSIFIGTTSKLKINAIEEVLNDFCEQGLLSKYKLYPEKVNDNFPVTPYGRETYKHAKKRSLILMDKFYQKDSLYIGIESGLVRRNGFIFEECWCVTINSKKKIFVGYSSGLCLPKDIAKKLKRGHAHADILSELRNETDLSSNETWGTYTGNVIKRQVSIKEACRNSIFYALKK